MIISGKKIEEDEDMDDVVGSGETVVHGGDAEEMGRCLSAVMDIGELLPHA